MVCPVCREPLTYDVDQLLSSPAPQLPEVKPSSYVQFCSTKQASVIQTLNVSAFDTQLDKAATGSSFRQKWCELQKLLERQRAKGGIIDPEVESNRFLIHINEVRMILEIKRTHLYKLQTVLDVSA